MGLEWGNMKFKSGHGKDIRNKYAYHSAYHHRVIFVDEEVFDALTFLEHKIKDLRFNNIDLQAELNAIKPIVENKQLEPATSKKCKDCKYCVVSPYNGDVLKCCKNAVCDDFKPKGE